MPRRASMLSLASLLLCLPACTYTWQGTPLRSTLHPDVDAVVGIGGVFTSGVVFAHAMVCADKRITLAVDSAAPGLYLDPAVVEQLSPEEQRARRVTLVLNGITLEDVPFVRSEMTSFKSALPVANLDGTVVREEVDGVIGLPSFGDVRLVFEFSSGPLPGGRLRVTPRSDPLAGEKLRYLVGRDGFPRITARVGEKSVAFILDTGFSGVLSLKSVEGVPHDRLGVDESGQHATFFGIHTVQRAQISADVQLGPIRVDRPTVSIGGPFPPLLGVQFFRGHRITFDHPARAIAIEPLDE